MFKHKLGLLVASATAFAVTALPAHAAIDVTAVTTEIAGAAAPIAAIGAAVLVVLVGVKVFKWIGRAL